MECFDAELDNQQTITGGFSAHLTTTPVKETSLFFTSFRSQLTPRLATLHYSSTLESSTSEVEDAMKDWDRADPRLANPGDDDSWTFPGERTGGQTVQPALALSVICSVTTFIHLNKRY